MTASPIPAGVVDVGALDEFPVGAFRIVDVNGAAFGILRSADGTVRAVRNRCPHQQGPICEGQLTGTMLPCDDPGQRVYGLPGAVLRCPWHAYEFDLESGRSLFGTFRGRLQTLEATVEAGRVLVRLGTGEEAGAAVPVQ